MPKLGEISTAIEEKTQQAYQAEALESVRTEHSKYFEALSKHPRLLVGQQVPSPSGEGFETLSDAADAKDWQDAIKSLLADEVRSRTAKAMEENSTFLETVHASIDLFKNNPDLLPGSKGFDVDLANQFAELATPYELRVDGKLQGYSIPVQPIIDQLRARLAASRATAAAAPPAPPTQAAAAPQAAAGATTPPAAAAPPQAAPEQPQAGIPSKAGAGSEQEDFSTLFGTIGLPNLQI